MIISYKSYFQYHYANCVNNFAAKDISSDNRDLASAGGETEERVAKAGGEARAQDK